MDLVVDALRNYLNYEVANFLEKNIGPTLIYST